MVGLDRVVLDGTRPGDGELPPRPDQVRVGQVRPIRLHRRLGCLEDLGVARRVAELVLGDLGQGVARPHDVLLGRALALVWRGGFVRNLQHGASGDEVWPPVQHALVELDDLWVAHTIAEQPLGDLPQAVAALDGVVDGRLLALHRRNSRDGRNLCGDLPSGRVRDGRSGGGVDGRGRERRDDHGRSHEEQCSHGDELAGGPLGKREARDRGSGQSPELRHCFDGDGNGHDRPGDPRHEGEDDQGEGPVVRAGEQAPQLAQVRIPGRSTDGEEGGWEADHEQDQQDGGCQALEPVTESVHCSVPPRVRTRRAEASPVTIMLLRPTTLRNWGL